MWKRAVGRVESLNQQRVSGVGDERREGRKEAARDERRERKRLDRRAAAGQPWIGREVHGERVRRDRSVCLQRTCACGEDVPCGSLTGSEREEERSAEHRRASSRASKRSKTSLRVSSMIA